MKFLIDKLVLFFMARQVEIRSMYKLRTELFQHFLRDSVLSLQVLITVSAISELSSAKLAIFKPIRTTMDFTMVTPRLRDPAKGLGANEAPALAVLQLSNSHINRIIKHEGLHSVQPLLFPACWKMNQDILPI